MKYHIYAGLRKDKEDKKGRCPIYIFVFQGKKQIVKQSTGQKIHSDFWNEDDRRVKSRATNATLINATITKQIADLETLLLTGGLSGNSDAAKVIQAEKVKDLDFFEFADKQIKQKSYRPESRRLYTTLLDKLKSFRKGRPLKLREIDFLFLQSYEAYLRDELKNEHNTIWSSFKFLNTIFSDAVKAKVIDAKDNPFLTYNRPRYKETIPVFLEAEELERIEDFIDETEDDNLKKIGTYFLFMCYTGLRYSDGVRFKSSLHTVGNKERITMQTTKTGNITNILINDQIRRLIPFIDANRLHITQVEYNRKLKIIAAGAGIKKNLTSHVARHTFGSSLVDLDVPVKVAQALLSHGSERSTKLYYHVKSRNLDEAMKKFNKKKSA